MLLLRRSFARRFCDRLRFSYLRAARHRASTVTAWITCFLLIAFAECHESTIVANDLRSIFRGMCSEGHSAERPHRSRATFIPLTPSGIQRRRIETSALPVEAGWLPNTLSSVAHGRSLPQRINSLGSVRSQRWLRLAMFLLRCRSPAVMVTAKGGWQHENQAIAVAASSLI